MTRLSVYILILSLFLLAACNKEKEESMKSESKSFFELDLADSLNLPELGLYFQDNRDEKIYKFVKIGSQFWMAENLNYTIEGSWCYRDSSVYCEKRGRLYSWRSAKEACPEGWRLPSNEDWAVLRDYVISKSKAGCPYRSSRCAGFKLKKSFGWQRAVDTPVGSDEFGFSGVPGGMRLADGSFSELNRHSYLWSATEADSGRSFVWDLWYNANGFYESFEQEMGKDGNKNNGFSVRCVKD